MKAGRFADSHALSYDDAPRSWRDQAACKGIDTELFYPVSQGTVGQAQVEEAKAFCRRCVVREACLAAALERREPGVWGGTSEDERDEIRRRFRRRAATT